MESLKAKKLLIKINSLFKGMENDGEDIAQIEKDLMKSYIRQLYEIFSDIDTGTVSTIAAPKEKVAPAPKSIPPLPAKEEYKPPRIIELPEEVKEIIREEKAKPKPVVRQEPPEPVVEKKIEVPPTPAPVKNTPPPAPSKIKVSTDEDVLELFQEKKVTDLSEKLSTMPVSDLMKSMGLNERILTVNELFDGDANAFKKVMTDLNNLDSFEEAKRYLALNVVGRYGWTKRDKKNKAKVLIKTIRRRYHS